MPQNISVQTKIRHGNVCLHLFVSSKSVNFLLMTAILLLPLSNSLFSRIQTPAINFAGCQDKSLCHLPSNFDVDWGFIELAGVRNFCQFSWSCSFFPLSTVDTFLISLLNHFVDALFLIFLYRTVRNVRFLFLERSKTFQKCFILKSCNLRDPH